MRIERVAVNASPLIALFKSGQAHLLPALFSEILVPDAVWREVTEGGHDDPAACGLLEVDWAIRQPSVAVDPLVAAWDVGPGESELLTLARARPYLRALLDDELARRCARTLGVRTLGTLGILLLAQRRGVIPAMRPAIAALRGAGLWLSDDLIRQVLEEAGER